MDSTSDPVAYYRKATIGIIIFVYVFGYLTSWFSDYYLSCCKFYLYYGSYSYAFLDTEYNVANIFVDTPVNFIASGIAVANYIIVYIFIHISNRRVSLVMGDSIRRKRRAQKIKYLFQFTLCTVCCIATWVSFRVFSALGVPKGPVYLVFTTFQVFHSATNSLVFLIFNKEFRQQFRLHVLKQQIEDSITLTSSPVVANLHTTRKIGYHRYRYIKMTMK
ncbi:hypothetical protein FO519_009585 [Halicephalobus sp. NKZ332]|nr:hypothetical protein FO519_009585 [Halicephalobus sp. NKZ332]